MRQHGRARISQSKPQAQAVCDRCGFRVSHSDLSWQFDWIGPRMQNKRILVCHDCYDRPQENIRTIVLPPDPVPIMNPRAEDFTGANNPLGGLGWDARNVFSLTGPTAQSAIFGTLTGGGGPDAVFFGGGVAAPPSSAPISAIVYTKPFGQSATFTPGSTGAGANNVGINWSALAGAPTTMAILSSLQAPTQSYVIKQAIVAAPSDTAFLGSSFGTTIELDGSNDNSTWTSLVSSTTAGLKGEVITLNSTSTVAFAFHRIAVAGDATHAVAIGSVALSAAGPSAAQTASELGA